MQYTIAINDSNVSASQLNLVLTIDKTLDYGSFVVRNNVANPYLVGDLVDIDITDGTNTNSYHFIVSADDVTELPNGKYLHEIDIIELTKILEWQTETVRTFTQPPGQNDRLTLFDVVTRLQLTAPIEEQDDVDDTRIFRIDNDLRTALLAVESPEFVFNNKNLKEILIEVFDFINAIPRLTRVSGQTVLIGDFFNEKGSLVTENAFTRMQRFNINGFSTALDADIKNLYDGLTTVIEPSDGEYKKLTSIDGDLTTDTAIIGTDFPIVNIESVKVRANLIPTGQVLYNNPNLVILNNVEVDITDQVVEKEVWEDLTNKGLTASYKDGDFRDNTLYFERFKPNIKGIYDEVGALSGASIIPGSDKILAVVQRAVVKNEMTYDDNGTPVDLEVLSIADDFYDIRFQITYKAQFDSRTQVKRLDTDKIKYQSAAYTGQTDNVVRADRALSRLFKLQQLLGNAEIMTAERLTDLTDLHNLSDYNSNDYIITTIELQCEKNYIIAKYMWSQYYQKVSEFIGLNSDLRSNLFAIPNDTYRRNVYIENFVQVGTTSKAVDSVFTQRGINVFMNTFNNTQAVLFNRPVNVMAFENPTVKGLDTNTFTIVKPVAKYGGTNSINLHVDFSSAASAGWRVSREIDTITINREQEENEEQETQLKWYETLWELVKMGWNIGPKGIQTTSPTLTQNSFTGSFGKPVSDAVYYTDHLGRVFTFGFQMAYKTDITSPQIFPVVEKTLISEPYINTPQYLVYKDPREELAVTFTLQVLPEKDLEQTVIIGTYMTEKNNLIVGTSTDNNQFEVVGTNTPYDYAQNRFSRASDVILAQTYTINATNRTLTLSSNVTGYTTWAIRKKDTKELVVAVNQGSTPISTLYFNFVKKQTGITYPSESTTVPILVARPTQIALDPGNAITDSTISILWVDGNSSPASDEFEIGISSNLVDWTSATQAPGVTNSFTFSNLLPLTNYTIRIRAKINDDYSEWAYFEATTIKAAPAQVANVTATLLSERRILIEWDEAADDIFSYRIEASASNTFSPLITGGLKATFFNNTSVVFDWLNADIEYDTTYYFRVRALRNGQFGSYSSTVSITTSDSPITSAPIITNVNVSGSSVSYTLVNTDNQLVTLFSDFSNATTSRATNVRPNEAVSVTQSFTSSDNTIFAKAKAELKDNSEVVSVPFAAEEAPDAPGIPVGGLVSESGLTTVSWVVNSGSPEPDGFIIERNPDRRNVAQWGIISDTVPPTARSYLDTTFIAAETTYTYRVIAYNRIGSATSNERSVTTIAMKPAAPTIGAVQQTTIIDANTASTVITWSRNSTNETGFIIEYRETSTMASFVVLDGAGEGASSKYVIFDRVPSGTKSYIFRVKAFNEFGESAPSSEALILI